jgi:putative N6-adenine-specific DNA methylase
MPGLEDLTAGELRSLGVDRVRPSRGGVEFVATTRQLYASNVWLRTATRVVVRVGEFTARRFDDLERQARHLDWERFVAPRASVDLRVSSSASRLFHTGAIAERLQRTIPDAVPSAGRPEDKSPEATSPDLLVIVRLHRDRVTISVDSSGQPLHKRGWRADVGKAPLRETLAAGLLLAAGWSGAAPLVDPFCGSGTIPIEAALLAGGAPPGAHRAFAFQRWPGFEPGTWASVRATVGDIPASIEVPIVGSDRDAGAVERSQANAERAGVAHLVEWRRASISDVVAPAGGPGWLVSNPPYGARLSAGDDLRDLYARLGAVCRQALPGWSVGLLVADPRLAGHTRLDLHERLRTSNGGLRVRFLTTGAAMAS